MASQLWLLAIAVALATPAAAAIPLSADGKFPFLGAPAFLAGGWAGETADKAASISMIRTNQLGVWVAKEEGVGANLFGAYDVISSFQCVDASTALLSIKRTRIGEVKKDNTCAIVFANETTMVARWNAGDAGSTSCPDSPFGDAPDTVTIVNKRVTSPLGIPIPKSLACLNKTVTPEALQGLDPVSPTIKYPDLPPHSPYTSPGGSGIMSGIWEDHGVIIIADSTGYAALGPSLPFEGPTVPKDQMLYMLKGHFIGHTCLGPNMRKAFLQEAYYLTNGTVQYSYTCDEVRRETFLNGTTFLYLALGSNGVNVSECSDDLWNRPDSFKTVWTLVEDLPWNPSTECTADGGTSPSPGSSPALPSGGGSSGGSPAPPGPSSSAVAIRLAALPAALLLMMLI